MSDDVSRVDATGTHENHAGNMSGNADALDLPDVSQHAHRAFSDGLATATLFPYQMRRGVLSDNSIIMAVRCGLLVIDPFNPLHVQPASYDLTLAQDIILAPYNESGHCALADTIEWIEVPDCIRGELTGRSSVARQFVAVHCTGGYADPG